MTVNIAACDEHDEFVIQCTHHARQRFQVDELRPSQINVLRLVSCSKGVLAALPTGAGKTFLYALPALAVADGVVLVISPLISLMRDQARRMNQAGIQNTVFTSEQSPEERRSSYENARKPENRIIFCSPERLFLKDFLKFLRKIKIYMAVVDEAHCVFTWGPGFRPEYSSLAEVFQRLSPAKIVALTATASTQARRFICKAVFPKDYCVSEYMDEPLAKNISIKVTRVYSEDEKWTQLVMALQMNVYRKSIVYFPTRKQCEQAALSLQKLNLCSVVYHAGLDKTVRQSAEIYIQKSTQRVVVCATQAFGMGVDLPDIDLVIVYGFPGSLEDYVQMIGRAGRNGLPAQSIFFWTGADPKRRFYQFQKKYPDTLKLQDILRSIASFFPGENCKVIVTFDTIISRFKNGFAYENPEEFLSILKNLQLLDSPIAHQSYLSIKLAPTVTLDSLLASLPVGITKRSRFLIKISELVTAAWKNQPGGQNIFTMSDVCEDDQNIQWSSYVQVLEFFAAHKKLSWSVLDEKHMKDKVILKNDIAFALKSTFQDYLELKSHFLSSLKHLDDLVTQSRCRMIPIEHYFSVKNSLYSSAGLSKSRSCGRCDLCVGKFAGTKKHSFLELNSSG